MWNVWSDQTEIIRFTSLHKYTKRQTHTLKMNMMIKFLPLFFFTLIRTRDGQNLIMTMKQTHHVTPKKISYRTKYTSDTVKEKSGVCLCFSHHRFKKRRHLCDVTHLPPHCFLNRWDAHSTASAWRMHPPECCHWIWTDAAEGCKCHYGNTSSRLRSAILHAEASWDICAPWK